MNLPHLTDEDILAAVRMYREAEHDLPESELLRMAADYLHECPSVVAEVLCRCGRR